MQRRSLFLAMVLAGTALFGYAPPTKSSTKQVATSPAAATRAVEQLFSSYAAHDCAALDALLGGKLRDRMTRQGCDRMLEHEPLRQAQLVHIGRPRRDGRDTHAWMVDVVVRIDARPWPMIVRVKHNGERHQIVAM